MKIQFVIPLSLFILVSGWFIGTKTWESHTSATEIEKSLCSKTFNCPSRGINSPSQSSSRLKPTGNVKTGSKNKTSPSTPKTSEKKSPNPPTDDIGLENPGN
jgi:hypothetical protein